MATLNIGIKVNRAITGATTVSANSYAIVTYIGGTYNESTVGQGGDNGILGGGQGNIVTRYFGPGQAIPATIVTSHKYAATVLTVTHTLASGVELINTQ